MDKDGYALNTQGEKDESHHPVFQIISTGSGDTKTNYYCLNAMGGDTWTTSEVTTPVEYNQSYNLKSDLEQLKKDEREIYKNIANSDYLQQILWILDNVYVPDAENENNEKEKEELLARAGIVKSEIVKVVDPLAPQEKEEVIGTAYKYVRQEGFKDYLTESPFVPDSESVKTAEKGWYYTDRSGTFQSVEIPDELIEVAQQAALWHFTNYEDKTTNKEDSNTFNIREQGLQLKCSTTETESNVANWPALVSQAFEVETDTKLLDSDNYSKVNIGRMKQDQATILCWYLIDAANKYADQIKAQGSASTGVPLAMAQANVAVNKRNVEDEEYYVLGPIQINKKIETVYELSDTIKINNETTENAYISDAEGNKLENTTLESKIGQNFYVAVPKNQITDEDAGTIKIKFEGKYKTNEKILWTCQTNDEQPIVEVTPKDEPFELEVTGKVPTEKPKELDLALRKKIVKVTDKNGKVKQIICEDGKTADRTLTYETDTIQGPDTTATYKHRKDPVVVEVGDKVTYEITIYNEGEANGYATKIVDQLPESLKVVPNSGTCTSNDGTIYNYAYDESKNTITFTNQTNKVLEAYESGDILSQDSIQIDCVVTSIRPKEKNKYLTNIAYIAEEFNDEQKTIVEHDRDSSTTVNPSETLETEGDKYPGYHGGNEDKNVYTDGTNNDDYFPGEEDDDDFEVVVIKPAEFDLALQKYISKITSKGVTRDERKEPTIDSSKLADGTASTATYKQDKSLVKVKHGDYVTYTFTVYNEGDVAGYVDKITDNIPKGLQFAYIKEPEDNTTIILCDSEGRMEELAVDEDTYNLIKENNSYWSIDVEEEGDIIKKGEYNGETDISISCDVEGYLRNLAGPIPTSYQDGKYNYLYEYDSNSDENNDGSGLDRLSVTVVLRVEAEDGSGVVLRNEAAITEAEDDQGTKQDIEDLDDRDSHVTEWSGKDGEKKYQDDEDYDNVWLGKVDLALTKFIAAISEDVTINDGEYLTPNGNEGSKQNPYTRATSVDTSELKNDPECHNATYNRVKDSLVVPEDSYVLYDIRVYNEGEVDVYAGEVKDYLPEYLDFVDCDFNTAFGWQVESDGKTIKTSYLSAKNGEKNLLKAFDKQKDDEKGSGLDYRDLQILCRINSQAPEATKLVNTAEISKYEDEDGDELDTDTDSEPDNIKEKNKEKREQDDDDYEVVEVKKKKVDLALTKFIAAVSEDLTINDGEYLTPDGNEGSKENPYTRATSVDTSELKNNPECHDATYNTVKTPLTVPAKSYVLYDIRVYNEGEVDVYAGEVTDHLPEYLDFVDCDFNTAFGWQVESDGKTIKTNYLSEENGAKNLLKAFDKAGDDEKGSGLDYRDLQVLCKVNDNAPTKTNIVNVAEITEYEDENGDPIPKDEDSTPDNVDKKDEDDDDYEVVEIKTFDLSLLKYVSTVYVTEDGKTTVTQTGNTGDDNTDIIPKVEIHRKKMSSTIVKFGYTIKVTNEGDIAGYAKEITDYVPAGLKFYEEDNQGWVDEGNNVISTRLLENTLLQPGESAEVTVIFRWINGGDNLGEKTNVAEITEDYNEDGVPDKDSTPDNQEPKEDDIDDATVLLSVSTGILINIVKYMAISLGILVIFGAGILGIKKFVL